MFNSKSSTLIEVLVASLILVISVVSSMMILQTNYELAISTEKTFVSEHLIRAYLEECANQNSRNGLLTILEPYTTKITGTIKYSDGSSLFIGTPLDTLLPGAYGIDHNISLRFELETVSVPSSQSASDLIKVIAITSSSNVEYSVSSILTW